LEKKSPYKRGGMFEGASRLVFEYAKNRRKRMTAPEMLLWGHLKKGINGYKFRRQHPIGSYIADLYCHKLKLVIEVDGSIHDNPDTKLADVKRESDLKDLGYSIIRFSNEEVLKNLVSVLEKINLIIKNDIRKTNKN
jgi:very-short-patch-repair endonuclease